MYYILPTRWDTLMVIT